MSKPKLLVCGATGFIGRHLAERLTASGKFEVTGTYFTRPPYECPGLKLVKADLTDPNDVERVFKGQDIVVQAAATTSGAKEIVTRPHIHTTDNAVMNSYLFRQAHESGVRQLVFFSCTIMYPSSETALRETDFDANAEMNPKYFGAGWTKVYLEKLAEFYSRLGKTKYTVLRHSNIYGPRDKFDLERSHVFGATVTKVMTNTDGKIVVWGDGSEERDLLYIDDLVECVALSLEKQQSSYELLNVGYGESFSIRNLVQNVIRHSGKDLDMVFDTSKPTIKTKILLNIDRARERIGWTPKTSIDDGIKKTLEWYRKELLK